MPRTIQRLPRKSILSPGHTGLVPMTLRERKMNTFYYAFTLAQARYSFCISNRGILPVEYILYLTMSKRTGP